MPLVPCLDYRLQASLQVKNRRKKATKYTLAGKERKTNKPTNSQQKNPVILKTKAAHVPTHQPQHLFILTCNSKGGRLQRLYLHCCKWKIFFWNRFSPQGYIPEVINYSMATAIKLGTTCIKWVHT